MQNCYLDSQFVKHSSSENNLALNFSYLHWLFQTSEDILYVVLKKIPNLQNTNSQQKKISYYFTA